MNIQKQLLKAANIQPKEVSPSVLLFIHAFCSGIFLCFYFSTANTVFVQNHGTAMIPPVFVASGILGFIIIHLFSALQTRWTLPQLYRNAFIFMFLVVNFCYLAYIGFFGNPKLYIKPLTFIMFTWIVPFFVVIALEFGGLMLQLFDLRQSKRLYALIASGEILAFLLGYFSIPILKNWTEQVFPLLLFISIVGIILSFLILLLILNRFKDKISTQKRKKQAGKSYNISFLFKDKYFTYISTIIVLSVTAIYFADFGFLGSVKLIAKDDELVQFIALFYGVVTVVEFSMSLLAGRLLNQFGIKFGLTILPVLMCVCVTIAALIGISQIIIGQTLVIFLFLFLAINRMIERAVGKAIDKPTVRILYQPLPKEERIPVQTLIDGIVKQIGIILAGVLLMIINYVCRDMPQDAVLAYFSMAYVPLMLAWVYVAFKLYELYNQKLQEALVNQPNLPIRPQSKAAFGMDVLINQLRDADTTRHQASVQLLHEINPIPIAEVASRLLKAQNETLLTQKLVLQNIYKNDKNGLQIVLQQISEKTKHFDIKQLAEQALNNLKNTEHLQQIASTRTEKHKLIHTLRAKKDTIDIDILLQLLKDDNRTIKIAAIDLASELDDKILQFKLVELLEDPQYRHICGTALVKYDDAILGELKRHFNKTTVIAVQLKIIELYSKIGSPATQEILLGHFNHTSHAIQDASIRALFYLEYRANEKTTPVIKSELAEIAASIFWRKACIRDLRIEAQAETLVNILEKEIDDYLQLIFVLLSFLYNRASIQIIQENIADGNDSEGKIFALELMDNLLEDDLKQFLFPLFENSADAIQLKKVEAIFPQQELSPEKRLINIINNSYNRTYLWTKAQAINLLTQYLIQDLTHDIQKTLPIELLACLYHPHPLLYELTALVIQIHPRYDLKNYYPRIQPQKQRILRLLFEQHMATPLLFDRVKMLQQIPLFQTIPSFQQIEIARHAKYIPLQKGEQLNLQLPDTNVYLIASGALAKIAEHERFIIPTIYPAPLINPIIAIENTTIFKLKKTIFFNILANDTRIAKKMIDLLSP